MQNKCPVQVALVSAEKIAVQLCADRRTVGTSQGNHSYVIVPSGSAVYALIARSVTFNFFPFAPSITGPLGLRPVPGYPRVSISVLPAPWQYA
jgi:hypothetical protein